MNVVVMKEKLSVGAINQCIERDCVRVVGVKSMNKCDYCGRILLMPDSMGRIMLTEIECCCKGNKIIKSGGKEVM